MLPDAGAGAATFYYASGWGKDTISGFGDAGDDKMILSGNITKMKRDTVSGLVMTFDNDTNQKLTVAEGSSKGADKTFKWQVAGSDTTYKAKIGYTGQANTFTYDEDVAYYWGSNQTDTVKVTGTDEATIWLGHDYGGHSFLGVDVMDASGTSGDVLAWGSESNDTLKAGKGNTSLFGGFGGNDLLQGNSSGTTTFYFGKNGGKDTITGGSSKTDIVMLYDVSETDINYDKSSAVGSDLTLVLNDGSSLTIKSVTSNVNTFKTADGAQWTWDNNKKTFNAAE